MMKKQTLYGPSIALGTNMIAGMALFTFLGYKLDCRFGGGRMWTLGGMFLGLVYGGYEVWKLALQLQAAAKGNEDRSPKKEEENTGDRQE